MGAARKDSFSATELQPNTTTRPRWTTSDACSAPSPGDSGGAAQLSADQRRDLVRHVGVAGVVRVDTVGADQVGPADEPPLGDRVDERRAGFPGLFGDDVARLE